MAPFHMVVNFQEFSPLNPLFLELKLKCSRMIKHLGWFVLSVGRRVALRPSHGHLLGCWWRAHGPLGYQLTPRPPPSCGTRSSQPDLHTLVSVPSSCHVELREWKHSIVSMLWLHRTQITSHFTEFQVCLQILAPTVASHYPSPSSLSSGHCPLVRDTHQHLVLLIFVYFTPQSPRSRKLY